MLTRALACLGLANLLLLSEWLSLDMLYNREASYFADIRYPLTYAWSTALAVVLIGAGLTAASTLLEHLRRSRRSQVVERLVLAANALVIIEVWMSLSALPASRGVRLIIAAGLAAAAVACVVRLPSAATLASGARLLAFTALLFPILLGYTLVLSANYRLPPPVQAARSDAVIPATNRLIWVVFDELDSSAAFDRRPSRLRLPELDRLRAESLVATSAYAPGAWTLDALPTLWTGRPVSDAREAGPSDLRLTFVGSAGSHTLAESPTVFARAHSAGLRVGIAGWYHPYCRLFGAVAEQCEAVSFGGATTSFRRAGFAAERGILAMVPLLVSWHAPWSLEAILTGGLVRSRADGEETMVVSQMAATYKRVHARSLDMVRDPSLSLVFAHYPVPHFPGFYDPVRGEIDITGSRSYMDNLALVDRTLGELRGALEEAGLWSTTTLLVHSDHALRPRFWQEWQQWTPELEAVTGGQQSALTPFMLKLPDQQEGAEYGQSFSVSLAHDLVLAVLDGRLRSSTDVTAWLDANRGRVPLSWPVITIMDR